MAASTHKLEHFVTTTWAFDGYRVREYLGIARGSMVRARTMKQLFDTLEGETEYAVSCRDQAYEHMLADAATRGANAILGMRFHQSDISNGIQELVAYGTAVIIERIP